MSSQQILSYLYALFVWAVSNIAAAIVHLSTFASPSHSELTWTNAIQVGSAAVAAFASFTIMRSTLRSVKISSQIHDLSARIYDLTYRPYLRTELSKPYFEGEPKRCHVNIIFENNGQIPIMVMGIQAEAVTHGTSSRIDFEDTEFMLIQHESNTLRMFLVYLNFEERAFRITMKVAITYKGITEKCYVRNTWYEYDYNAGEFNKKREWEDDDDTSTPEKKAQNQNGRARIRSLIPFHFRGSQDILNKVSSAAGPIAQVDEASQKPAVGQ